MEEPRQTNRPIGLIAGVAIALVVAGAAVTWWVRDRRDTATVEPTPTVSETVPQESGNAEQPAEAQTAEIYLLQDTGTAFELVPAPVSVKADSSQPEAFLTAAFEQLLSTPQAEAGYNAIPEATQLESLKVTQEGIRVNLSSEFTTGGGSASMMGRLGQVVYTATSLDADAPVWLSVNGEPLELLGGEGLMVPQPITREQFDTEFSL